MAQDTLLGFPAHTLPFRRGEFTTLLTVCAFGSIPGQDPKAAKYAVLTPSSGMFVNVRNAPRVVIAPPSEMPPVSPCEPLCAIFLGKPSVYPLSPVKANVGRFAGDCDKSFFAVWYPLMEVGDGCL